MKGLIILGNYFEDTEAITTINILRRAKISLDVVAVGDNLLVKTQTGLQVKADYLLNDINIDNYSFLVIPGGKAVYEVLGKEKSVLKTIDKFVNENKLIAAICAAPSLIGERCHFKNHEFTCFPTCEKGIKEGKYLPKKSVIRSGNFITGKAMGYTSEFAYEIVEYLLGKKERQIVEKKCKGEL